MPLLADPVTLAEIADRLGLHRQTPKQWRLRKEFPEPKWHPAGAPLWEWNDVLKWLRKTGRLTD